MAADSRRPLVGITSYVEQARWGSWDTRVALVPYFYVCAVESVGGRAVVLPPDPRDAGVLDALDGLVVAGGADVSPDRYGAEPHALAGPFRPDRDAGELCLLAGAVERDLPVLGVCRGMQLMAVHAGGALIQHLPDVVGHDEHRPTAAGYGWHEARFAPGSRVASVLGKGLTVNSHHHQGIAEPGALTVTGWAYDDTVEVLEDPSRRFWLGIQWHPEATDDVRLFGALVDAAT